MSRTLRPSGLLIAFLLLTAMGSCDGGCDKGVLDRNGLGGMGVIVGAGGAPGAAGAQGAAGDPGTAGGAGGERCGSASCSSNGYLSGPVTFSSNCSVITSECSECTDAPSFDARCDDAPAGANPWTIKIAATDQEIGLLWLAPDDGPTPPKLQFARLSANLELLGSTLIEADTVLVDPSKDFSVAPSPSGWIVAGSMRDIFIHAIDPTGADLGRTRVDTWDGLLVEGPVLVPRPDGAPLIAWVTTMISASPVKGVLHVAAVAADGLSVGPVHEETTLDWTHPHGFAFFGDAFFGAIVAGSATNPGQIRVQRIAADGTLTSVADALSNVNATSVAPIACGDSLCLVYHAPFPNTNGEAGSNFLQQKIDATGTGVGNIGILSYDSANAYAWAMPVTLGGDIVTVLGGADDALDVVRFSPTSQLLTLATSITRSPGQARTLPAIAVRGSDLVVVWKSVTKRRSRIARIAFQPAP
jgi:hypothetical protein